MDKNTKLEVAFDIMSSKIADAVKSGCDINSDYFDNLLFEKEQMYAYNEEVIDKIINVYGKELKNKMKRGGKNGN